MAAAWIALAFASCRGQTGSCCASRRMFSAKWQRMLDERQSVSACAGTHLSLHHGGGNGASYRDIAWRQQASGRRRITLIVVFSQKRRTAGDRVSAGSARIIDGAWKLCWRASSSSSAHIGSGRAFCSAAPWYDDGIRRARAARPSAPAPRTAYACATVLCSLRVNVSAFAGSLYSADGRLGRAVLPGQTGEEHRLERDLTCGRRMTWFIIRYRGRAVLLHYMPGLDGVVGR